MRANDADIVLGKPSGALCGAFFGFGGGVPDWRKHHSWDQNVDLDGDLAAEAASTHLKRLESTLRAQQCNGKEQSKMSLRLGRRQWPPPPEELEKRFW